MILTPSEYDQILAEATPCRNCGHPVAQFWDAAHGLRHLANDFVSNRGCRAASFVRLGTWDDSLDRRWQAKR